MMNNKNDNQSTEMYKSLRSYIEESIAAAEELDDIASEKSWREQLDQLDHWISSGEETSCPIPLETWISAGLERPEPALIIEVDDVVEEDAYQKFASQIEEDLRDEEDSDNLLRNYKLLYAWISDPANAEEAEPNKESFKELAKRVKARRIEISQELLAKISKVENLREKETLLGRTENWNPSDEKIGSEIEKIRVELDRGLSVEDIRQHLVFLESTAKSDLSQFGTSLRVLETRVAQRPDLFSAEDRKTIRKKRDQFDAQNNKADKINSINAAKGLVEKYIAYLEIQNWKAAQFPFGGILIERAEAETKFRNDYEAKSKEYLQNLLSKANSMAINSPSAAIIYLEAEINDQIEREINEKKEQINRVPLTPDDKQQLIIKKNSIEINEKPKEDSAKAEERKSKEATDLYSRLTHLIKSYQTFPLLDVDTQIRQLAPAASEERLTSIELSYEKIQSEIDRLESLHLSSVSKTLEKIHHKITDFDSLLAEDWFGVADYENISTSEGLAVLQLPPKPPKIKEYLQQYRGGPRTDLENSLTRAELSLETIAQVTKNVEQKLKQTTPPDVTGAIQEFNSIRDNDELMHFRAYKNLEQLVMQHQGLIEKRNRLQQLFDTNKYQEVLDYFYQNIHETKDFINASLDEKKAINTILLKAEHEVHTLLLDKYYRGRNFKASQVEMDWLRAHNMITDRNKEVVENLENIVHESYVIENFYLQAFENIGIVNGEIIPNIFSLQGSWRFRLKEGNVSEADYMELVEIFDDSQMDINEDYLFQRIMDCSNEYSFDVVNKSVHQLLYCGRNKIEKDYRWPELPECSMIEYDAKKFGSLLKKVLKSRILENLSLTQYQLEEKSEFESSLSAYKELSLQGDTVFDTGFGKLAAETAYKIQGQMEATGMSYQNQMQFWELVSSVFPNNAQLATEFRNTQIAFYKTALSGHINNKSWNAAYKVIEEIRKKVTHSDLLESQFLFFTNDENKDFFSIVEARSILSDLKHSLSPEIVKQREAHLTVAETFEKVDFNPLSVIQILSTDDLLQNQHIMEELSDLSKRVESAKKQQLYSHQRKNDFPMMVSDLAEIFMINDIMGKEVENTISNLLQDQLFKEQVPIVSKQILEVGENILNASSTTLIENNIQIESLFPRLSGILTILNKGYQINNIDTINKQLGLSYSDIRKSDLDKLNSALNNLLHNNRQAGKLKDELKNHELWVKAIGDSIDGKRTGWDPINAIISKLRDQQYYKYSDIQDLVVGADDWKSRMVKVSVYLGELRDNNNSDETSKCKDITKKIVDEFYNTETIFDSNFTEVLNKYADSHLSIRDSHTASKYSSIEEIEQFIESKKDEIDNLSSTLNNQEETMGNNSKRDIMLAHAFSEWQRKLPEISRSDVEAYLQMMNQFTQNLDDLPLPPPPDEGIQPESNESSSDRSFITSLFNLFYKKKETNGGESFLKKELEKEYKDITLQDQFQILSEILSDYDKMKVSIQPQRFKSYKAADMAKVILANIEFAGKREQICQEIISIADAILKKKKDNMLSEEDITRMWHQDQFRNIAKYLISLSPFIPFTDGSYLYKQKKSVITRI